MRVIIFHYNPIEKFPPVMNFLRLLETKIPPQTKVLVFTTKAKATDDLFVPGNRNIHIKRMGYNTLHLNVFLRFIAYFRYFVGSFIQCLWLAPDRMLYYETISSLVPVLLKKYFFRKSRLLIHYHEYMSEQDYRQMFLTHVFHGLEKKIYGTAAWISQTNEDRMVFFLNDIALPSLPTAHVVPNYPLRNWAIPRQDKPMVPPVRLVYVGSFGSMDTIYVKEILHWVQFLNDKVSLDIYSFNMPATITSYINELDCKHVRVMPELGYYHLPEVLRNYDVGLILYKGLSKNFEYNAPNKLFEYLACGLDVWYPQTLKGIWQYDTDGTWPKVCRLNFDALNEYTVEELVSRAMAKKQETGYYCEEASSGLLETLIY